MTPPRSQITSSEAALISMCLQGEFELLLKDYSFDDLLAVLRAFLRGLKIISPKQKAVSRNEKAATPCKARAATTTVCGK